MKFRCILNSDFQLVKSGCRQHGGDSDHGGRQHGGSSDPGGRQHGGTPSPTAARDREGTRPTDSSPSEKGQAQAAKAAGAGGDPRQRGTARHPNQDPHNRPTRNNRAGKRGTRRAAAEAAPSPSTEEGTKGTPHYDDSMQKRITAGKRQNGKRHYYSRRIA